jgi:hypothetical protein
MINAINIALGGLATASNEVAGVANTIAQNAPDTDLAAQAVNLDLGKAEYKANLAVIKTVREMDDALFHAFDQTV